VTVRAAGRRRGARRIPTGWAVYLLRCRDGSLYAGATIDLARRLLQHQAGRGARYTRSRLPVALVWWERARDRSRALRREAAVKRLTRAEKLVLLRGPAGLAAEKRKRAGPEGPAPRSRTRGRG
jgi:putative endonuclease